MSYPINGNHSDALPTKSRYEKENIKLITEIYMQAVGILQCRLDDEYIMYVQMNYA